MQTVSFALILLSTAYAPKPLLAGWQRDVADVNPVNFVLEGVRQAYVYGLDWERTWQAYAALAALVVFFGLGATRLMRRVGR
jgi:ABC-type multidrug transport system permease subunit